MTYRAQEFRKHTEMKMIIPADFQCHFLNLGIIMVSKSNKRIVRTYVTYKQFVPQFGVKLFLVLLIREKLDFANQCEEYIIRLMRYKVIYD